MNIARSTFYHKRKAKSPDQMETEADLRDRIEAICLEFPRYGYRRVTWQLKRERWAVNHKRVLRLMRESDLLCRVKRKYVKTTDSKHGFPRYLNLIKKMLISHLNQVWLTDITYIRIRTGFVYLAAILDAYSRRVIGYAISTGLDTALTLEAPHMAIDGRSLALVSFTTQTKGYSTPRRNTQTSSRATDLLSAWPGRAIPMRTPGWKASSKH